MNPGITDDTVEIGEATLAVIGLSTILRGEMPRVGVGIQKQIVDLPRTIDKLADDFVYDRLPKKISMPRPFTYRQLLEKFSKPIPADAVKTIVSKFPHDAADTAISFMSTLTQAYTHVADMLPVADYDTYLGPKRIMPTSDKTFEFFNKLWVIDNPLIAFQLMQCGGINTEQVAAIIEFFPSIHNYMKKAILDALVARNHREASFMNLPPRADYGLATFKQQRIVPFGPNTHAIEPPKPQAAANPAAPPLRTTLQTAGQKAAEMG